MISLSHLSGLFLGVLLGFVMQRGRFCLAGGLRDLYLFRDSRMLIAILIVISVQSIGLFIFSYFGIAKIPGGTFPWLATLAGGLLLAWGWHLPGPAQPVLITGLRKDWQAALQPSAVLLLPAGLSVSLP